MDFVDRNQWPPLSKAVRRQVARLRSTHGRAKTGLFLIEGFRLLDAALAACWPLAAVILRDDPDTRRRFALLLDKYHYSERTTYVATPGEIQEMSDTVEPPGILAVARQKPQEHSTTIISGRRLLVVDNVRDPGNLGAVFRSAAAFGVDGVYVSRGTVDIYNPKVIRSSMGGFFLLPIVQAVDPAELAESLQDQRYIVYVADPREGRAPVPVGKQAGCALVIGGETAGLSGIWREHGAQSLHIPTAPAVESLNSAVAAGILLYQLFGDHHARPGVSTRRSTTRRAAGKTTGRSNRSQ